MAAQGRPANEIQEAPKSSGKHPANIVEALYVFTEQLENAARVLEGTYWHAGLWRDLPPERADALEKMIGGFDFLMTAKSVRAYADAWQDEIDGSVASLSSVDR